MKKNTRLWRHSSINRKADWCTFETWLLIAHYVADRRQGSRCARLRLFGPAKRRNCMLRPMRRTHAVAAAAAAAVVPPPRKPVLLPPPLPAVDFAWRTRDRHLGSGEDDVTGTGHGRFIHCRLRASHRCRCTRVLWGNYAGRSTK